jgi:hypothetical protein
VHSLLLPGSWGGWEAYADLTHLTAQSWRSEAASLPHPNPVTASQSPFHIQSSNIKPSVLTGYIK